MNVRIGTLLPLIISALAMMAVVSAGPAAYEAFGRRQESEAFLKVNQISKLLLRSAGQWAVERGLTNGSLKSPEVVSAERRAEIVKARAVADQAFHEAARGLRAVPAMKVAEKQISEAENAFQLFETLRNRIDEDLAKPRSGRTLEVVDGFVPAITNLIEVAGNKLRLTQEALTSPPRVALSQLVGYRHLAAQMAENAGRERGFLSGITGARSKLSMDNIRAIATAGGEVELAWGTIVAIRQRGEVPAILTDAIAGVESEYFGRYGQIRGDIFAASETGAYNITGGDYFKQATTAIDSILQLADAIGIVADQEAANEVARSTSNLTVDGAVLLISISLALVSFWVASRRILRPLAGLTGGMKELAQGNFSVVLPGLDRQDEIGDAARAVETFKLKAEQKAGDEAEAKIRQEQSVAQQRRADMIKLADTFEAAVGDISLKRCRRPRPNSKLPPQRSPRRRNAHRNSPPWWRPPPRKPLPTFNRWLPQRRKWPHRSTRSAARYRSRRG